MRDLSDLGFGKMAPYVDWLTGVLAYWLTGSLKCYRRNVARHLQKLLMGQPGA